MSYKNKFSAFVDGYTKVKNAEADRELREQEAERRSQEFEFRKRELERSEAEAKRRLDLENGLRDAANPEKDAGTITTGGTRTFTQAPDIAAGVGKIEADIAELEGRPAPTSEAGFGLRKSGEMVTQKSFSDPLYGLGRQANYLSSIGRGDEALKLNAAIDQERGRKEANAQTELSRAAMKAAQDGGPAGFAAWYNSLGKPSKLRVIPSPSGKGQALVKEVDGMPAGQYSFDSDGEFFNAVQMFADPSKAAANAQAQANARAASQAEIAKAYNTQLARNQANNTNGRTAGRAGGSGVSTSGSGSTPGSISMTDVAKTLSPFFMKNDPATGQVADPASYQVVRQLVPRMPSAKSGDSEGAAIEALAFYQRALDQTKGDKPAALKLIASIVAQNSQPAGGQQPAPSQPPAAAAPVAKKEPKRQDPTIERAQLQFKKAAWGLTPEESARLNELLQGLNTNSRTGSF